MLSGLEANKLPKTLHEQCNLLIGGFLLGLLYGLADIGGMILRNLG
jgi:hypothetical protein